MTDPRICAYEDCAQYFTPKRPHQRFCKEEHRYRQWELDKAREGAAPAEQRVERDVVHPLDDARGQMREGRTSAQWELVAREKVARTLLDTGEFTADDLADLNIPVDYRRHIHGAATGFFAGAEPFMDFVGRQKSARPSRKGAKNDLYAINAKGRRELPKLLRDLQRELPKLVGLSSGTSGGIVAAAQSGEKQEIVGVATGAECGSSDTLGGNSGDESTEVGTHPSSDTKCDEGLLPLASPPASDSPVLQLDIARESESSAYGTLVEGEAA